MRTKGWWVVAIVALAAVDGSPARAQDGYPDIGRDEEIRLAMSAGPLELSKDADVWILGREGFEKARSGTNGFSCLVVRNARNRGQLAPHCLNPAATETVLPAFRREAELQMQGLDADAIGSEMGRQWANGELPLPKGPAYAYMMSAGQKLGSGLTSFRPHFMLYMPNLTNEDIAGDPSNPNMPFVGPFEGHPLSTVVIMMPEFVDPSDVALPGR
jgi:hypothetical protein